MIIRRLALPSRPLLVLLLLLAAPAAGAKDLPIPPLTGRVVDEAGILDSGEEGRLTGKLADLEAKSSIQLVVVTLPGLQGRPIEEWGLALGRTWGIGQEGTDNGVLLIVAPSDRELRIEVGYGLEGTLPDATADNIIRNVIVPRFKSGDMPGGISDGVDAIAAVLTGSGEAFTPSRRELFGQPLSEAVPALFIAFFAVMMFVNLLRQGRRRRGYYRNGRGGWIFLDDRSSGGGSGGFSSGSGGFSGGGGSFGGGGASGRW